MCVTRSCGIPFNHSWELQHIGDAYSVHLIAWRRLTECSRNLAIHIRPKRPHCETNDYFSLLKDFPLNISYEWNKINNRKEPFSEYVIFRSFYNRKQGPAPFYDGPGYHGPYGGPRGAKPSFVLLFWHINPFFLILAHILRYPTKQPLLPSFFSSSRIGRKTVGPVSCRVGVGDVNFPRTRLLCGGCPPLGWDGWTCKAHLNIFI